MRRLQLSHGDPWQRVTRTSLMLLLLMIAISPITQNVWKGDDFFHGLDIETTLVLGLTLASMSLLRMQRGRIDMDETLRRVRDFLSSTFGAWLLWYLTGLSHYSSRLIAIPHSRGRPGKHTGYELPLLI
jgi:hypothetical protein